MSSTLYERGVIKNKNDAELPVAARWKGMFVLYNIFNIFNAAIKFLFNVDVFLVGNVSSLSIDT